MPYQTTKTEIDLKRIGGKGPADLTRFHYILRTAAIRDCQVESFKAEFVDEKILFEVTGFVTCNFILGRIFDGREGNW